MQSGRKNIENKVKVLEGQMEKRHGINVWEGRMANLWRFLNAIGR